jgi:hypothetical protein
MTGLRQEIMHAHRGIDADDTVDACLYGRFYARDPLSRARALAAMYPKGEIIERVQQFLARDDEP